MGVLFVIANSHKFLKNSDVQAMLTHPMFGPDSSRDGFQEQLIVMDQFMADEKNYQFWKSFFINCLRTYYIKFFIFNIFYTFLRNLILLSRMNCKKKKETDFYVHSGQQGERERYTEDSQTNIAEIEDKGVAYVRRGVNIMGVDRKAP